MLLESCKDIKAKIDKADSNSFEIDGKSATTMTRFGAKFHLRLVGSEPGVTIEMFDLIGFAPDKRFIETLFKSVSKRIPVTTGFDIDTVKNIEATHDMGVSDSSLSQSRKGSLIVDPNLV